MGARFGAGLAFVWLAFAFPCLGQAITDPTKPAPQEASKPPPAGGGAPTPFTFTGVYTADILSNISGGLRHATGYIDQAKLSASYDGASSGRDGWTGLVSIEHLNGNSFSDTVVGAKQFVSNVDNPPETFRLYEAWVQREILQGVGGVKVGLIDLNTTFDVQETAALFLNASHGIGQDVGQTGLNGPSIEPTTALAVTSVYRPTDGWTLQAGVFDGVAGDPNHQKRFVAFKFNGGALLVAQVERRFGDTARLEAGAWTYTAAFDALDQAGVDGAKRKLHGNSGVYGLVEGKLAARPGSKEGGLSGWLRLGLANGDINPVSNFEGAGVVYTGLIPGRDKDETGIAIARAGFGGPARHAALIAGTQIGPSETDIEATYRYAFKDWLNIQPDVQYVIHPGGRKGIGNALVIGLRLAFTISK